MDLSTLIGALRGGHETTIDRATGKKTHRYYSPKLSAARQRQITKMMPTKLREYQLHNKEADLGLTDRRSYSEFARDQE